MGQILDNGVFLPDEGERNCYSGLAENWVALDTLVGAYSSHYQNTTIHVTASDKQTWNGKQDALSQTQLDAVNSGIDATKVQQIATNTSDISSLQSGKADDNSVMHLSGNEDVNGTKTFKNMIPIDGDYLGNEANTNQRTNICLRSNRDTSGKSGAFITKFRQNRSQGALQTGDLQMIGFDVLENEVRTNNVLSIQCTDWLNDVPKKVNVVSYAQSYSYGNSARKALFNDLNPGALSFPDLNNGLDISGYLTNVGPGTVNEYTPVADGWISIANSADTPVFIRVYNDYGFEQVVYSERNEIGSTTGGTYTRFGSLIIPCIKNVKIYIIVSPSTSVLVSAKFFPCLGNV